MANQFTDQHLKVHLRLQQAWEQDFVDAHEEQGHHGQTKLLWSNLLGLALVEQDMQQNNDCREIELVVAGASPGTHMLVLLKHVTKWRESRGVRIHLYDPQPLDARLKALVDQDESMCFERKPFTDQHAQHWKNREHCVVFFSDIRSRIHSQHEHMRVDESKIEGDMQTQRTWVKIMQPDYCMLKFHAPHATRDQQSVPEIFPYLHGDLYEQGWVRLFSAEYRLFCTKRNILQRKLKQYKTTDIERHAFWHTKHTRPSTFSVDSNEMQYDEAFATHVAHKAQRALGLDAEQLLRAAERELNAASMQFPWPRAELSRAQALHLRMLQIL